MMIRKRWFITILITLCSAVAPVAQEHQPGVVVEKVSKFSAAEKAGIQSGDILLGWTRADSKGELVSPFDLALIEVEEEPRGMVTLNGIRGTASQSWIMGPDVWGIQARPNVQGELLASYNTGQELAASGRATDAAKQWQSTARLADAADPSWLRPWLLFHAAESLRDAKQWTKADEAYQSAVQSAGANPIPSGQLLQAWAKSYQERNDWDDAKKYFQQSIARMESSGSGKLVIAANLNALGRISYGRGDLDHADQYYRQGLDICQKLAPGSLPVAAGFNNLGWVAWQRGDLAKAEQYHKQALDIRQKLAPESLVVATSLFILGIVARDRGDLGKAEQYHAQALDIRQKLAPESLAVALSLDNLGIVAWGRGDLAKAEQYCTQAFDIQQKLAPVSLDMAAILNNLGIVALERRDLAKAEQYYAQAFDIQQKLAPGTLAAAWLLGNLGIVSQEQGDLAKAEQYYAQALAIAEKVSPGSLNVARNLDNLGNLASDRGDLAKAERYHGQALEIQQKLAPGSMDVAESLNNLGDVARGQGDLAKAERYCLQALEIRQRLAPGSMEMAHALASLGNVAKQKGDLAAGEQYYREELKIRKELAPGSKEYAQSLAAVASILRSRNQLDAAAEFYAQAVSALESQTARLGGSEEVRSGFRARHLDIYQDYISLLLAQNQKERALEVLEHSRARTLLEMLTQAHIDIRKGVDGNLLAQERSLRDSLRGRYQRRIHLSGGKDSAQPLKTVDTEISELSTQYQELENTIRVSSPEYAALTQPQPLTAQEIQQLLDPDTLLLEYSLGEERSYLWLVSDHSLAAYELPKRRDIEKLADHIHQLLTSRGRWVLEESPQQMVRRWARADAEYRRASAELSRMVLEPVAGSLGTKRLLIVADGALQYVPFQSLPSPKEAANRQTPLLLDHEIVNLPSASVLAELRLQAKGRKEPAKAVAVLADPVFDPTDQRVALAMPGRKQPPILDPMQETSGSLTRSMMDLGMSRGKRSLLHRLPYTRREANSIMAATPEGEGMLALDFQANLGTATSPDLAQYRIVHFATHGLLDNKRPEFSGLVFSLLDRKGKPQDGFLGLEYVYNLNLPVDLVVLSGCQTGLGEQINGEGLIGLTRGFIYAGASRVVASLWEVNDAATAELMARFYKAMERDRMPPAAALRAAQIEMIQQKTWSAPYYWAAFQIHGEWR
jgi:CHAT domain-containing protein/Tfp pilus assembly protein PilF